MRPTESSLALMLITDQIFDLSGSLTWSSKIAQGQAFQLQAATRKGTPDLADGIAPIDAGKSNTRTFFAFSSVVGCDLSTCSI
jgi:hypothetical protein